MLRFVERTFWILGTAALFYCAWFWLQGAYAQAQAKREFSTAMPARESAPREGDVFGRIEIPSVRLSAVIFEGTTEPTLTRGVGHMIDSARPGKHGNIVLAGHRDTYFRPLRKIEKGDHVTLQTREGSYQYRVQSIRPVDPDAVEVTLPTRQPVLTLITCYPFTFIGSAPQRYIVRAVRQP